jgi:hypothetical protein
MPRFSKRELLQLQRTLKNDVAIGNKFGITHQAVQQIRKLYGIPPLPSARTPAAPRISKKELIKLQNTFKTDKAIADNLGVSQRYVFNLRKRYGIASKRFDTSGRDKTIAELYAKGFSGSYIAKRVNLSLIQVYRIIRALKGSPQGGAVRARFGRTGRVH